MASRQVAHSGQRSWRSSPAQGDAAPFGGSKRALRGFFAVVVLLLLGWLGWLLTKPLKREPPTFFVALTTGSTDSLSIPPLLFERETLEPLIKRSAADPLGTLRFIDGSPAHRLASGEAIRALFAEPPLNGLPETGRLIVYVSAHGVSDDGNAYLLAGNFDVRDPTKGRYLAADLIQAVSQVKTAAKLIVFDCSRIAASPRMGMALNEFASLVAAQARSAEDPNLWVMLPGRELEISPLGLADRRAALGGAVVDALVGGPDKTADGDRNLSLAELDAEVQRRCRAWRSAAPAPQLIFCGDAALERPAARVIAWLAPVRVDKKPTLRDVDSGAKAVAKVSSKSGAIAAAKGALADQAKDDGQGAAKQDGTAAAAGQTPPEAGAKESPPEGGKSTAAAVDEGDAASKGGPATADAPPAGESAGPPTGAATADAPPVAPDAPEQVSPIVQAWRLRDELNRDQSPERLQALPVDYAPHFWNELNAMLARLHLLKLAQSEDPGDRQADPDADISKLEQGLARLQDRGAAAEESVAARIGAARRRFEDSSEFRELQELPVAYARAVLELRRGLARANQYVDWHAAAHCDVGGSSAEFARLINQILDRLIALDEKLRQLERTQLRSWDQASSLVADAQRLRAEIALLDSRLTASLASSEGGGGPLIQRRRENLLATALPTAADRDATIVNLSHSGTDRQTTTSPPPNLSAAADHLRLEAKLVRLVEPDMRGYAELSAVLRGAATLDVDSDDARRSYRKAGAELRQFYSRAPERLRECRRQGASVDEQRTAEKLAAVMHPRDALMESALRVELAFAATRLQPPAELGLTAPDAPLELSTAGWTNVDWKLTLKSAAAREVRAVLESDSFDDSKLRVQLASTQQELKPGTTWRLAAGRSQAIALRVQARQLGVGASDARTLPIRLVVKLPADEGPTEEVATASVILPHLDRLELTARCVEPPLAAETPRGDGVLLRPFPNRETSFQFEITNRSGRPRDLHLEFYGAPTLAELGDPGADGWPTGWLLDSRNQPPKLLRDWAAGSFQGATPVAVADISLNVVATPRLLQLAAPAAVPAAGEEPPKEGAAADAKPPAEAPATAADVTRGLLCRITEKGRPNEIAALKWVAIVPRRPATYVDVQGQFDVAQRGVRFEAAARIRPPGLAKNKLAVSVVGDGRFLTEGGVRREIDPLNPVADLLVQPARNAPTYDHTLYMDIDGFPRAVVWTVNLDKESVTRNRDRRSVIIERIGMQDPDGAAGRMYLTAPNALKSSVDVKQWTAVDEVADKFCAFNTSRGARQMEIRLRVDAPVDRFQSVGSGDYLELTWNDAAAPVRFYDDRDVRSQLMGFTKDGGLTILSSVQDLTLTMQPPGANNVTRQLSAKLFVNGEYTVDDSRKVIFDDEPPKISDVWLTPRDVAQGTPKVNVGINMDDISGAGLIEAWVVKELPEVLDPKTASASQQKPDQQEMERDGRSSGSLTLEIPSEKWKASPYPYLLVVRVTDRSGQAADTLARPLRFKVVPFKPDPKTIEPEEFDFTGLVSFGSKPAPAGLEVSLYTADKKQLKYKGATDDKGRVAIKKVKKGEYTATVKGFQGGREVVGEQPLPLNEKKEFIDAPISSDWKEWPKEEKK